MVARLVAAVRADDQRAYEAVWSSRDPTAERTARLLRDNLRALGLAEFEIALNPTARPVAPDRAAVLGPAAWQQQAVVSWRLPSDDAPAVHQIWMTFVDEGAGVVLAGAAPPDAGAASGDPATTEPVPIWWLGPVEVSQRPGVTVVTGGAQRSAAWIELAGNAARRIEADLPVRAAARPLSHPVVEVPGSVRDFAAVCGRTPEQAAGIAATALLEGDGSAPVLHVVVNPEVARIEPRSARAFVLRHELVHAATDSPTSAAPLWAVEGFAEWVAWRSTPHLPVDGAADLRARVRQGDSPAALPPDRAYEVGAASLVESYAEAWSIWRYVQQRFGAEAAGRLYAELDRGRPMDPAGRAALGVSSDVFVRGWRRWLDEWARSEG